MLFRSATVSMSDNSAPTGTVTFYLCFDASSAAAVSTCAANSTNKVALTSATGITLNRDGSTNNYLATFTHTPTATGFYRFNAVYSGHTANSVVIASQADNGANEDFKVTSAPTASISTSRSSSLITIGQSVTDTATVSMSDNSAPTGTVTFYQIGRAHV